MKRLPSRAILLLCSFAVFALGCGHRRVGGGTDGGAMDDFGTGGDSGPPRDLGTGVDLGVGVDLGRFDSGGAPFCGDFTTNGTEQCDQGAVDTVDCDSDCTLPMCGDRHVNHAAGEECDDGPSGSATCDTSCALVSAPVCGDGVVSGTEACDDGGRSSFDGCSSTCTVEAGYTCMGMPSFCTMGTTGSTVIHSGTNTITGSISTSDPTWTRPDSGVCTASTYTGAVGVHYHTQSIRNGGTTTLSLTITAAWTGFDGFLAVYPSPFSGTASASCLATNDDFGGTSGSQVTSVTIAPGATEVVVATTFSNSATLPATFMLTIDAV